MTRSSCSKPSSRVSWSLAESQARSEHFFFSSRKCLMLHKFLPTILPCCPWFCCLLHYLPPPLCSRVCRRGSVRIQMENSLTQSLEARVTGRNTGLGCKHSSYISTCGKNNSPSYLQVPLCFHHLHVSVKATDQSWILLPLSLSF